MPRRVYPEGPQICDLGHVPSICQPKLLQHCRILMKVERVGILLHLTKQIGGMDDQVLKRKSVPIVIQEETDFTELLHFFGAQIDFSSIPPRHFIEIVAVRSCERPCPVFPRQQPINYE